MKYFAAETAYISHLLYYGYENELPFDDSNQVFLENGYKLKKPDISTDSSKIFAATSRPSYLREIRIDNVASENPRTLKNISKCQ